MEKGESRVEASEARNERIRNEMNDMEEILVG